MLLLILGKLYSRGDQCVKVWNINDDDEYSLLAILKGHTGQVWSLQFDKKVMDGNKSKRLYTGSEDTTVKVWNSDNYRLLATLDANSAGVVAMTINDNKLYSKGGEIKIWKI